MPRHHGGRRVIVSPMQRIVAAGRLRDVPLAAWCFAGRTRSSPGIARG